MKVVKGIAAFLFLVGLGLVLVQPVLDADGGREDVEGKTPVGSRRIEDPDDQQHPSVTLSRPLPGECFEIEERSGLSLVAAQNGKRVRVGLPTAGPTVTVRGTAPIRWSPSGLFFGDGKGRLYDLDANREERLFSGRRSWDWSPAGDCAIAATEAGLEYGVVATGERGRLWDVPAKQLAFSPNGRRLAVSLLRALQGGLWMANLETGETAPVVEEPVWMLGWFSNRSVLYSKTVQSGKLRYATGTGGTGIVRGITDVYEVHRCGSRVLVTASPADGPRGLYEIVSSAGALRSSPLAAPRSGEGYLGISCSPDETAIVASELTGPEDAGPLVLLSGDGTFLGELDPGATAHPLWGPPGEGILYLKRGRSGTWRVWQYAENGVPRPTGFESQPEYYDWSLHR